MNLREKYYFFQDDIEGEVKVNLKEIENDISEFEKKSNLKITEEHKDFLLAFPVGGRLYYGYHNELLFDNEIYYILSIHDIKRLFYDGLYDDAFAINLIPFAMDEENYTCFISGDKESFGYIYAYDNVDDNSINNKTLVCKSFDIFMSSYKKQKWADE